MVHEHCQPPHQYSNKKQHCILQSTLHAKLSVS
jgi:hypothetical protein